MSVKWRPKPASADPPPDQVAQPREIPRRFHNAYICRAPARLPRFYLSLLIFRYYYTTRYPSKLPRFRSFLLHPFPRLSTSLSNGENPAGKHGVTSIPGSSVPLGSADRDSLQVNGQPSNRSSSPEFYLPERVCASSQPQAHSFPGASKFSPSDAA